MAAAVDCRTQAIFSPLHHDSLPRRKERSFDMHLLIDVGDITNKAFKN